MAIEIKVNVNGEEGVTKLADNVSKTSESVKTLKQQFIDARKELMNMDESDPGFLKKAAEAGQLKDQISDMNAVIKATAGSTTENLGNALTGVASIGIGAFQGIASAQALFGSESEDLQKVLVKLQAAAGMADAIKSFGQFGDTITEVKAALAAVGVLTMKNTVAKQADIAVTGEQIVATEGATVAQYGLNTAMLANPIFLVIAAIGAVVAAYTLFSDSTDYAAQSANELTESIQNTSAAFGDYKATLMEIYGVQNDINAALSDKDVILAQDKLTDILRNRPNDYQAIAAAQAELNNAKIKSAEANKKSDLEAFDLETKLDKKRYQQIYKDIDDLNNKRSVGSDEEKAARLKLMDDLEKEQTALFNKELTRSSRRDELEIKLNNSILQTTIDGNNKIADIQKSAADYAEKLRLEEDAKKKESYDANQLLLQKQNELELNALNESDRNKKKAADDWLNTLEGLQENLYLSKLTDQQKEIQLVNDKYFELQTLAGTDAEAQKLIEENKKIELTNINDKYRKDELSKDKEFKDAQIAAEQSLYDAKWGFANGIIDAIGSLAGKSKKIADTVFLIQKGLAIAQVVVDTQKEIAGYAANPTWSALPDGGASVKGPMILAAKLRAATSIATIAATSVSRFMGGGSSAPSGGNTPAPPQVSSTPSYNLFGNNNNANIVNATPMNVNVQNEVKVKAYVSETEITDSQKRIARYQNSATL